MAFPNKCRFGVRFVLAFLAEFLPFTKGIETRKILSWIPPWAAISKICPEMPEGAAERFIPAVPVTVGNACYCVRSEALSSFSQRARAATFSRSIDSSRVFTSANRAASVL